MLSGRGFSVQTATLQAERDDAAAAHEADCSLHLVIGRLEEFAGRVCGGLDQLDWHGQREIIRALVRRIEIDHDQVEIVFRVPGDPVPSGGGGVTLSQSKAGEPAPFGNIVGGVATRLIGAILLEQNDEWPVQRRYMILEMLAPVSDDPAISLSAVAD